MTSRSVQLSQGQASHCKRDFSSGYVSGRERDAAAQRHVSEGYPLTHRKNAKWQTWKTHVVFYYSADAGDAVDSESV